GPFRRKRFGREAGLPSICRAMKLWRGLLAAASLCAAYGYGAASYAYRFFPIEQIGALKRSVIPDEGRDTELAVYSDTKGREAVSCWSIEPDAAVILAMGQSNAGNYGETRYRPVQPVINFNWADGKCYRAEDPLLGST